MVAPTGAYQENESKEIGCPTHANPSTEFVEGFGRKSNPEPPPENETAAPTDIGSGGEDTKAGGSHGEHYHHPEPATSRAWTEAHARALSAVHAFNRLEAEEQHIFAEKLYGLMQAGEPVPPFDLDVMAEARDWASWASNVELRAYAAACWEKLDTEQRRGFLAWACAPHHGQEAAA